MPKKGGCLIVVVPCKIDECVRVGDAADRDWQIVVSDVDG